MVYNYNIPYIYILIIYNFGAPQGSILDPLLFNAHLCDLFYFLENLEFASYADHTTIYTINETEDSVIDVIETSFWMV